MPAGRLANLLTGLGLEPGDRVAVQVEKSPEALILYLGTVRAGGVFLPLNTGYTAHELAYFLGDAEPRIVVCRPAKDAGSMAEIAAKAGVAHVLTLGEERRRHAHGEGRRARTPRSRTCRARRTIWPPSSTPRAPPAAPRGPC